MIYCVIHKIPERHYEYLKDASIAETLNFCISSLARVQQELDARPKRIKSLGETNMPINEEILKIKDIILSSVDCEKIYLFGSYAYGKPTADSDYDFYVVLKDDFPEKPIIAMEMINRSLMNFNTRIPIDVLANYKNRFEYRSSQPTIERKINKEGILLYG
jgi:predicted nucleotidyltransferase